jgi:hypothetical protein
MPVKKAVKKPTARVDKAPASKPLAKKAMPKVVKKDECCGECCGDCCGGNKCGASCWFWTIIVIIIAVVVGYFAYNEYNKSKAPFVVTQENGVTTVTPGPGMTPDGPPTVGVPTTPPPAN